MVLNLKRTENPINRIERQGINDNWNKIESNFNNVVEIVSNEAYEKVVDSAKLIWQQPVNTFADLATTYPNAEVGWAAWAREVVGGVASAYRYDGSTWVLQQQFIGDAINEVDNRLTDEIEKQKESFDKLVINILYPPAPLVAAPSDGVSDAAVPINNIVNYLYQQGGGNVFIPSGTYLMINSSAAGVFINARSNVNIFGSGNSSVLKLADGKNQSTVGVTDLQIIFDRSAEGVNNVIYRDFKVDLNGVNNISSDIGSRVNIALGAFRGSNILIDNVTVSNNAGRQCFAYGRNESPHTIKNITIQNCLFENVGNAVQGNVTQGDHSCLYIVSDGCVIANNRFVNPNGIFSQSFLPTATAIENHSNNSEVYGNFIRNFSNGVNIVAQIVECKDGNYYSNTIENVRTGFVLWSRTGFDLENIRIYSNTVKQLHPESAGIIEADGQIQYRVKSLYIYDNVLEFVGTPTDLYGYAGIQANLIEHLEIRNNQFINLSVQAIRYNVSSSNADLYIENNKILNCNSATNLSNDVSRRAILIFGNPLNKLYIRNNEIINTLGRMTYGIFLDCNSQKISLIDNFIEGSTIRSINTQYSRTYNEIYIRHRGDGSPSGQIRASIGSEWFDTTTRINYVKSASSNDSVGWFANILGTAPPTAGSFRVSDSVTNTNVTELGAAGSKYIVTGWRCSVAGTPGTWLPLRSLTGN